MATLSFEERFGALRLEGVGVSAATPIFGSQCDAFHNSSRDTGVELFLIKCVECRA